MTRVDFTNKITALLGMMLNAYENPIIDYVKRSDGEQQRLFLLGKSKCDGQERVSKHQRGKAMDIYFVSTETGELCEPRKGFEYWHKRWEDLGGRPMIEWDKHHFE